MKSLIKKYIFTSKYSNAGWLWPLKDLKYGVQNLFEFFKVIWAWRFWDFHYFLKVLVLMLKLMEKNFSEYGNHLYVEKDVKNMKIVRLLLERVLEDDYHSMVYKSHDEKWGKLNTGSTPCEWDKNGLPTMYEMNFSRSNAVTEEQEEQEQKEFKKLIRKPDQLRYRDLKYALDLMSKQLLHWWD